jgi:putative glutamine amidotransferase
MSSSRRRAKIMAAAKEKAKKPQPEPEVIAKEVREHVVQLMQDSTVEFPPLYMEVFVAEQSAEPLLAEMFAKTGCTKAKSLAQADLVVFTGGADINPELYKEDPKRTHPTTRIDKERDARDMKVYADALAMRIPMLGICRGAQFLHVMNGGTLYQDVDNHGRPHSMSTHDNLLLANVSSTHHQMCIRNEKMEVLATARKSTSRYLCKDVRETGGDHADIEAFFYPDTCCLGFQGHPEYRGYSLYTKWCLEQVERFIMHNPRVKSENNNYRIQKTNIIQL